MHIQKIYFVLVGIALALGACEQKLDNATTEYPKWPEKDVFTVDTIDHRGLCCVPATAITVHEAREIGKKLGNGGTSEQMYYIKGRVKGFNTNKHASGIKDFGNGFWYLQDSPGSNVDFYCYQTMGLNGEKFTSLDQIQVGDFVVVYSKITNYGGTIETTGKSSSYIVCSTNDLLYPERDVAYVDEKFATGIDHWTSRVAGGVLGVDVWKANTTTSGTTSAQANVSGEQGSFPAGEVWIESPKYDLVKAGATSAKLAFQHTYVFKATTTENVKDYLRVKVTKDGVNWDDFEIENFNTGKMPTYVPDTIDISDYISNKTQIAFAYSSSADFAPKWNVSAVTIFEHKRARDCN